MSDEPDNDPADSERAEAALIIWLVWLLSLAAVAAASWQVHTYVDNSIPATVGTTDQAPIPDRCFRDTSAC